MPLKTKDRKHLLNELKQTADKMEMDTQLISTHPREAVAAFKHYTAFIRNIIKRMEDG